MKTRLLLLLSLVGAVFTYGAEVDVSVDIRLGKLPPPPPPEVIVIEPGPRHGPPPWAPAHGYRRNHHYYYYPGADVYFRPADRVWFYLDSGDWRFGASLPTSVRVDFDRSVSLAMETDQHHKFHNDVRAYYPADYFVTKVKVKERRDKPDKADKPDKERLEEKTSERAVDDPPGKAKEKGKGKNK
jgi:hypothetical protein